VVSSVHDRVTSVAQTPRNSSVSRSDASSEMDWGFLPPYLKPMVPSVEMCVMVKCTVSTPAICPAWCRAGRYTECYLLLWRPPRCPRGGFLVSQCTAEGLHGSVNLVEVDPDEAFPTSESSEAPV